MVSRRSFRQKSRAPCYVTGRPTLPGQWTWRLNVAARATRRNCGGDGTNNGRRGRPNRNDLDKSVQCAKSSATLTQRRRKRRKTHADVCGIVECARTLTAMRGFSHLHATKSSYW